MMRIIRGVADWLNDIESNDVRPTKQKQVVRETVGIHRRGRTRAVFSMVVVSPSMVRHSSSSFVDSIKDHLSYSIIGIRLIP